MSIRRKKTFGARALPYLMITPSQIMLFLIIIFPAIFTCWLSFQSYTYGKPIEFVGWGNFDVLFKDPIFWQALWHNIIFVNLIVFGELAIALGIAIFLAGGVPFQRVMVSIVMAPYAVSTVIAVIMWKNMLYPDAGFINYVLQSIHLPQIMWTTNSTHAFATLVLLAIWLRAPFSFLILYNAVICIPSPILEAAQIDGASRPQIIRFIIFPLILPGILIAMTFRYIFGFRTFDIVWIMTKGGPIYATELLSTYLYRTAFSYFEFGVASAVALVMVIVVFLISVYYLKIMYKKMFA